jgi:pimeloyl-ACP methyl ester carboxylesterase
MSSSPQISAVAASDAYTDRSQRDVERQQSVSLKSNNDYTVFGYKNDPVTGFHATAYREVAPPHNIIIAYRGTDPDFKKHPGTMLQDIAVDATMVRDTINPQRAEASAFTAEMIAKAARHGISKDHVSVAGHSLGGTLAEIEAAKFGLRGITLNAYGAVGMIDGPPLPGCQLTNYRMAGDPVSGANGHIGTVVSLASPEDVASLQAGRYLDAPAGSAPPNPLIAIRAGDHGGAHFNGTDGNINVLNPAVMAEYAQRYKDHQAAFDHLSGDLNRERGELSVALRQMASGQPSAHLPPDVQRQVNEYHPTHSDTLMQHAA